MRLDQKIAAMAARLSEIGVETARLDARLLAGFGLGLSDTDIILQFDREMTGDETALLDQLLERRFSREPIAHILGTREFWGLPFKVTPDTLVPRPDSETLVSGVLERIEDRSSPLSIVDIGTGTGCLLLSLLSELPNARGIGVDNSEAALAVAKENSQCLHLSERASFQSGNYADDLNGGMDILISNPPYLAEIEMDDLDPDVSDYDPKNALVSGESGLEAYESIFSQVARWKKPPDLMAFEFGYRQAEAVHSLALKFGLIDPKHGTSSILSDFGGHDRVIVIKGKL